MGALEIITTSDGSHTLRNTELNETYHSIHGALRESAYVFIRNGLEYFHRRYERARVSILEVGFGTGLNALLAWRYAEENNVAVRYTTLEPFPLGDDVWTALNYAAQGSSREAFMALHQSAWEKDVPLAPLFTLHKIRMGLQEVAFNEPYDIIFFDAFAPSVQPELWVTDALEKVTGTLPPGGVFVTYSAKGQLKRDMRALGLTVETLPGPPGKNEMVRAQRAALS